MNVTSGARLSRYQIRSLLGKGGMGEVYLAEDQELNRLVALKILAEDPDKRYPIDQLLREARTASALNHQNIVTVYEIGEQDSMCFIASEFIEGDRLRDHLGKAPLPPAQSFDIAIQIAEGLAVAHAAGIVHGDITPENIMIRNDGLIKILDFGMSRVAVDAEVVGADEAKTNVEEERTAGGTLSYIAPELFLGSPADQRSDTWSLGVILYEMLAGRTPFAGETRRDLIKSILNEDPALISAGVPLALENIVRRALEKKPAERYASVLDLAADLKRVNEQLESDVARPALQTSQDSSANNIEAEHAATFDIGKLRAEAWRQRRFFLWTGVLLTSMAALVTLIRPHGSERFISLWLWLPAALSFLVYAFARRRVVPSTYVMPRGLAFRGLLPFQEADRDRFYGRESQTLALAQMIAHRLLRFGVLFGESGCGKTSLISAGLIPKLWSDGYVPVYCRAYSAPLAALLEECRKRSLIEPQRDEAATDYLQRVSRELSATIVVICDQFEEFFVNFKTPAERESFVSFVAACHGQEHFPVKFLFSLRSDFLYLINSEFANRIPEPLMSSRLYHLRDFSEEEAAMIIEKSARSANLPFAAGLSRHVARDLMSNGAVLPSELQIVGERLQTRRIYSVPEYQRAGGREQLVHGFLEDAIQASGERESAQLLLRSLISDENTRLTLPLEEIAKRTQRSQEKIVNILHVFVAARLIREIQDQQPWRYELMHEYLIDKINRITGRVLDATQRANRLFRQYLSNYSVDKRTRIPITKLWSIRRYADIERGERERELLRKSLRVGTLKTGVLVILIAIGATLAAAALSVNEEWDNVRMSDGHSAAVRQAVFSPDGRLLVSVGEDAKVIVWDFARRQRLATFTDHAANVTSVAFSPDGKWFATASSDHTVIVWDSAKLQKVEVLHAPQVKTAALNQENVAVAFSPDGRLLTFVSGDRTILWGSERWDKVGELPVGLGLHAYGDFLFSPDSHRLIYRDGQAWDIATGQRVAGVSTGSANWVALSADGSRLVAVTSEGSVVFLDAHSWKSLGELPAHRDHGRAAAFSPNGQLVATGAENIVLWDVATQAKLARLEHPADVWGLAFSPDGRSLVSTHGDGAILVWDVAERQRIANLNEHSDPVRAVTFSADGKHLASASEDGSVIIWDSERGAKEAVLLGHKARVNAVALSPDGKTCVSVDQANTTIFADVDRLRPDRSIKSGGYAVVISPDGRLTATNSGAYGTRDGGLIVGFGPYVTTKGSVYGLAFSPDGKKLTIVLASGEIILLDTGNWQVQDRVVSSEMGFKSVSFSPDGKRLVTGDIQGDVWLWDVVPLRKVALLGHHAARINSVAFAPDSRQVASAGDDQMVALWDIRGQRLITRIGAHTAPVLSIAFSPDGRRLATGEADRSVHIYTRHSTLWGYRWGGRKQ
ncbi:MAG: protein kinase [Pyrinomonadaceae bacterium]